MAFEFINKLPTPAEIKEQFPLPTEFVALKAKRDEEVKKVISGESDKFLVIIGPCSADNEDAVLDYTSRLIDVQEKPKTALLSYRVSTPTSHVPPVTATRACSISRTRRSGQVWQRPACHPPYAYACLERNRLLHRR